MSLAFGSSSSAMTQHTGKAQSASMLISSKPWLAMVVLEKSWVGAVLCMAGVCCLCAAHSEGLWPTCAGQLASAEWWELRGAHAPSLPPEAALQDALRDLVDAPALPSAFNAGSPRQWTGKRLPLSCGAHWALGRVPGLLSMIPGSAGPAIFPVASLCRQARV